MNQSSKNIFIFICALVIPILLTFLVYYFLLTKPVSDWQTLVATYATSLWMVLFISSFFENNLANILNNPTVNINPINPVINNPVIPPPINIQIKIPAYTMNGNDAGIVDLVDHTFQYTYGQVTQGLLSEINGAPIALAIFNNNGAPYAFVLPVVNGQVMNEVSGTSLNGKSCSDAWGCGSLSLNGVLTANTLNAIGSYSITPTFNGQPLTPNTGDTHGATVIQGQL
jgi:hypothetical protein